MELQIADADVVRFFELASVDFDVRGQGAEAVWFSRISSSR
jgi:hypothetical protein